MRAPASCLCSLSNFAVSGGMYLVRVRVRVRGRGRRSLGASGGMWHVPRVGEYGDGKCAQQ